MEHRTSFDHINKNVPLIIYDKKFPLPQVLEQISALVVEDQVSSIFFANISRVELRTTFGHKNVSLAKSFSLTFALT